MFKFVVFLTFAVSLVTAQDENGEVCQGQEDGTLIGVGADISCTQYWECENEIGYLEDCFVQGEDLQFDYTTGQCNYDDYVNCDAGGDNPDPEYPDPEYPDPDTTRATTVSTSTDSNNNIPDVECPTNRPGEIVFFPSSNCSEYFICANGFRMKMACMEGFTWNQDERQCDYPIFSRCSVS